MLLYGHAKNAYWYGSQLSIEETRKLAPYQNATGLQVTSAVLAGIVWMLENPERGLVEADEMDFRRCLEIQRPYLGPVIGGYTDWTPLTAAASSFPKTSTAAIPGSSATSSSPDARRGPIRDDMMASAGDRARRLRLCTGVIISCTRRVNHIFSACPISHVPVAAC